MQVHNAVHHKDEGGDEEHQDGLLAQAKAFRMGGSGLAALNAEQLCEVLAILVGVGSLGVGLDLLAVPVQVADDHDGAHDAAADTPLEALHEVDTRRVRGDNDAERVDRGERGAHGTGQEDSADANDGVIAER